MPVRVTGLALANDGDRRWHEERYTHQFFFSKK